MNFEYIRSKLTIFSKLSLQYKIVTIGFAITLIFMIVLGIPLLLPGVTIKQKKSSGTPSGTPPPEIPTLAARPSSTPAPHSKFRTQLYTIGTTETIPLASYTLIEETKGLQQMDDNGTIFYTDNNTVYTYKLGADIKTRLYDNTTPNSSIESLNVSYGKLYLTKKTANPDGTAVYIPEELDLASGTSKTLDSLQNTMSVHYQHLFKTYTGDIIYSSYTQGCAEHGTIYKYNNNPEDLIKTGSGCTPEDRYIGYLADSGVVVMATTDSGAEDSLFEDIYGYDVERHTSTVLFSLRDLDDVHKLVADEPLTHIAAMTATEVILINMKTQTISKQIPFKFQSYDNIVMTETKILAEEKTTHNIISLDLKSGLSTSIQIKGVKPTGKQVYYLGSWKKLPVFYYTEAL